eukprot:CAMPEP_0183823540 /NCGR_PEP_ID=MMETSP0807_2-20130328/114_1 /TAXON_ID=88271 /ORGANISM="Picocystis salinarum, Strain CCMP1897" /LENGTH=374 /DNA_ID=CAMNT_0026068443 /DNA_START=6853 /DNA_END=7974 /DNA_ORIENTATION=+
MKIWKMRKVTWTFVSLLLATLVVHHVWLEGHVSQLEWNSSTFFKEKPLLVEMKGNLTHGRTEPTHREVGKSEASPIKSGKKHSQSDNTSTPKQNPLEALQLPPNCTADQPCHVLIAVSSFIANERFRYDDWKDCQPGLDCHWCDHEQVPDHLKDKIDAVAYHLVGKASPSAAMLSNRKLLTIGASMESNVNYPSQKNAKHNFDLTMTYELDSDIPIPYLNFGDQIKLEHNAKPSLDRRIRAAAYVASNCKKERQEFVANLIKNGLPVDALGICSVEGARKNRIRKMAGQKIEALSKYAAYLAFENSDAKDYVTEKVYDGLRAGTITVYRGTTSVHKFVPENSIITTHGLNFSELVQRIKETWGEEARYAELQAW